MIRYFKTIQPAALLAIPVAALILWLPAFFIAENDIPAYDSLMLNGVQKLPGFLQWILAVALVSSGGIYLNHVINRHEVIYRHSYLPALFYIVLMSYHRDVIQFHPLLVSNVLVLLALDKTFSLFKNDSPVSSIFDSSFLLAVATLIYFPSFILFFLFLYAMYILRAFNFRELMVAVVGYFLPFFFLAVYFFLAGSLLPASRHFMEQFTIHKIGEVLELTRELLGFAVFLSVLVVLATLRWRSHFYRNTIKTRSTQEIFFLFFIFSAGGLFFLPRISLYHFTQLAIPFSFFLAYFFISARSRLWMYEAAFWILLGFIVAGYF